ncbi:hypothetical protein Hanom_Chr04g00324451 [Helianthus anomalus]
MTKLWARQVWVAFRYMIFLQTGLGQRVRNGTCHFGRELGRQRDGHMEYVSTTYGSR